MNGRVKEIERRFGPKSKMKMFNNWRYEDILNEARNDIQYLINYIKQHENNNQNTFGKTEPDYMKHMREVVENQRDS